MGENKAGTTKTEEIAYNQSDETTDPSELLGADEVDNSDMGALFPDMEKELTEDDLKGEDISEESEEAASGEGAEDKGPESEEEKPAESEEEASGKKEEDTATSQPRDEKGRFTKKQEEEAESETEPEETKEKGKPPEGYVPHQALKEEREIRQNLQRELRALRDEITDLKQSRFAGQPTGEEGQEAKESDVPEEFKEFKPLSEEEFEELLEDDPAEALKYQRKEDRYNKWQTEKARQEQTYKERAKEEKRIIDEAFEEMANEVPGLFDEDKGVSKKLSEFAGEKGLEQHFLAALTDPETLILPPGMNQPLLLGKGASQVVKFIHQMHEGFSEVDEKALTDKITAELTPKIEARMKKELLEKFKRNQSGEDEYKSLDEIPASDESGADGKVFGNRMLSEAELARLTPEQQEKYLRGETE